MLSSMSLSLELKGHWLTLSLSLVWCWKILEFQVIQILDELEREEFYRLKKVQDKKKKIKKAKEEEAAARKAAGLDEADEGGDIFNEDHDEDIVVWLRSVIQIAKYDDCLLSLILINRFICDIYLYWSD